MVASNGNKFKEKKGGVVLIYSKDIEMSQETQGRNVAALQKMTLIQKWKPSEV